MDQHEVSAVQPGKLSGVAVDLGLEEHVDGGSGDIIPPDRLHGTEHGSFAVGPGAVQEDKFVLGDVAREAVAEPALQEVDHRAVAREHRVEEAEPEIGPHPVERGDSERAVDHVTGLSWPDLAGGKLDDAVRRGHAVGHRVPVFGAGGELGHGAGHDLDGVGEGGLFGLLHAELEAVLERPEERLLAGVWAPVVATPDQPAPAVMVEAQPVGMLGHELAHDALFRDREGGVVPERTHIGSEARAGAAHRSSS